MGMSLVLFRIAATHFVEIKAENKPEAVIALATGSVSFDKTFHGLEYLLVKAGLPQATVNTLLYPNTALDEEKAAQSADFDFENADEDAVMRAVDYFDEAISYIAPVEVTAMCQALASVTAEQFGAAYSSRELNEAGIYPENWRNNEAPNNAFNRTDTVAEFLHLQQFYQQASKAGDYVFFLGIA